jgi:hypothetical protein
MRNENVGCSVGETMFIEPNRTDVNANLLGKAADTLINFLFVGLIAIAILAVLIAVGIVALAYIFLGWIGALVACVVIIGLGLFVSER